MTRRGLALMALLLSACGSGGSGLTAASFCEQWVTALCMKSQSCCTDPTGRYATVADCVRAQRRSCSLGEGTAFVNVPGHGQLAYFDPTGAQDALARARDPDCTMPRLSLDSISPPLVRGTLRAGDDCSPLGGDLSPTLACAQSYRCALGATRTGVLHGECIAEAGDGAPCFTQTCIADDYCKIAMGGSTGSCAALVGPLGPCFHDYECLTQICTRNSDPTLAGACIGSMDQWCYPGAGLLSSMDSGTPDVDAGTGD